MKQAHPGVQACRVSLRRPSNEGNEMGSMVSHGSEGQTVRENEEGEERTYGQLGKGGVVG